MLTQALYLSSYWFIVSFITLIFFGRNSRTKNYVITLFWFAIVIFSGNYLFHSMLYFSVTIFVSGSIWFFFLRDWNFLAKVAWVTTVLVSMLYLAYSFGITAFATANILGFTLALIFFFVEVIAIFLSLTYAFEALDILCRASWHRRIDRLKISSNEPKVSLHIPTYNEPAEVVIKTLENLTRLKYNNYEVIVIDNNTPDENVWRQVESACVRLGPRYKFYHLDKWPGYKSGALNFGLTVTAPDSELISIIDSDYKVHPNFLKEVSSVFVDKNIAFAQTPQDYRGSEINAFFKAAYYGYKYFFAVSMPSRNERNAIIFAGTMGLIRKSALLEIGGWDEWCITEDAEASLRILQRGYDAVYINKSYGQGLMPLTFDGFKKQRFRWCFGGIQILKKHWQALMPWSGLVDKNNKLTFSQRYYYLVGGLQWYNDLLNLFFVFFLLIGGILSLFPKIEGFRPFTLPLLIIPAIFLFTGLWRFLWVLRNTLHLSTRDALQAMFNFFSLGWAVTLGSVQGLIQKQGVFLRTPKISSKLKFLSAVGAAQSELFIGLSCIIAAIAFIVFRHTLLIVALGVMLLWESMLFMSAPVYSLISTSEQTGDEGIIVGENGVSENYAARWIFIIMAGIALAFILVRFLPTHSSAPYNKYQPNPVAVPAVNSVTISNASPTPTTSLTVTPTHGPTPSGLTPTPTAKIAPTNTPTSTPGQPTITGVAITPSPLPKISPTVTPKSSPVTTIPTIVK